MNEEEPGELRVNRGKVSLPGLGNGIVTLKFQIQG